MELGFCAKVWKFPLDEQIAKVAQRLGGDAGIYVDGRGAESLITCLQKFRGRGGILVIAADLRVLGGTQTQITDALEKLELAGIKVLDLEHVEHRTHSVMQKYAFGKLAAEGRWKASKSSARRTGKLGPKARAVNAAIARTKVMADDAVRRLVSLVEDGCITWKQAEYVTGGSPLSLATMQRHYRTAT